MADIYDLAQQALARNQQAKSTFSNPAADLVMQIPKMIQEDRDRQMVADRQELGDMLELSKVVQTDEGFNNLDAMVDGFDPLSDRLNPALAAVRSTISAKRNQYYSGKDAVNEISKNLDIYEQYGEEGDWSEIQSWDIEKLKDEILRVGDLNTTLAKSAALGFTYGDSKIGVERAGVATKDYYSKLNQTLQAHATQGIVTDEEAEAIFFGNFAETKKTAIESSLKFIGETKNDIDRLYNAFAAATGETPNFDPIKEITGTDTNEKALAEYQRQIDMKKAELRIYENKYNAWSTSPLPTEKDIAAEVIAEQDSLAAQVAGLDDPIDITAPGDVTPYALGFGGTDKEAKVNAENHDSWVNHVNYNYPELAYIPQALNDAYNATNVSDMVKILENVGPEEFDAYMDALGNYLVDDVTAPTDDHKRAVIATKRRLKTLYNMTSDIIGQKGNVGGDKENYIGVTNSNLIINHEGGPQTSIGQEISNETIALQTELDEYLQSEEGQSILEYEAIDKELGLNEHGLVGHKYVYNENTGEVELETKNRHVMKTASGKTDFIGGRVNLYYGGADGYSQDFYRHGNPNTPEHSSVKGDYEWMWDEKSNGLKSTLKGDLKGRAKGKYSEYDLFQRGYDYHAESNQELVKLKGQYKSSKKRLGKGNRVTEDLKIQIVELERSLLSEYKEKVLRYQKLYNELDEFGSSETIYSQYRDKSNIINKSLIDYKQAEGL